MPITPENLPSTFIKLAWNKGHFNLLKEYCCKDFQYHTTFNERALNFFEYVVYVNAFRSHMPDLELTIEQVMVKDNTAILHTILSGTIKKPFFGLPASDKLITFAAMSTMEMEHGKVKTLDSIIDIAGIQRQLQSEIDVNYPLEIGPKTTK